MNIQVHLLKGFHSVGNEWATAVDILYKASESRETL